MYEVICKYCGTRKVYDYYGEFPRVFCNAECQRAYAAKRKREKRAEARQKLQTHFSATITPEEQCAGCYYGGVISHFCYCNYFEITGHTRHSLHPDGLPPVCEEYKPKKKSRSNAMTIKQRRK